MEPVYTVTPGRWINRNGKPVVALMLNQDRGTWQDFGPADADNLATEIAHALNLRQVVLSDEFLTLRGMCTPGSDVADILDAALEAAGYIPVVITLCTPDVKPGETYPTIARFATVEAAEEFLATSATIDPDYLAAGYYSINAPRK